jgi:threonyl-tRNA synthetase
MLVVGDKEMAENNVAVRLRTGEQLPPQSFESFREALKKVIKSRASTLNLV